MKIETVEITPEFAKTLLNQNENNRKLSRVRVEAITRDILDGNWVFDGSPIRVSSDGELLDGQHRLAAVCRAGVPVVSLLIIGLERDSSITMDSGKSRTLADQLKMQGEKNSTNLSSVIKACYSAEKDGFISDRLRTISNQEALQFLEDNPEVREALLIGRRTSSVFPAMPTSVAGGLYFIFSKIDEVDAKFFFEKLPQAAHEEGSPILALREALISKKVSTKNARGGVSRLWYSGITIKAWNAFREGREIKSLRFSPGGAVREKVPVAM